ncbi:hypothetical protein KJ903_01235 [Patescibacteria group bacterium]|nr:hypothetical protein [Patescibacteria group bacterium]
MAVISNTPNILKILGALLVLIYLVVRGYLGVFAWFVVSMPSEMRYVEGANKFLLIFGIVCLVTGAVMRLVQLIRSD